MSCGFPSTELEMPFPSPGIGLGDIPALPEAPDFSWATELGLGSLGDLAGFGMSFPDVPGGEIPDLPEPYDFSWAADLGLSPPAMPGVGGLPIPTADLPEMPDLPVSVGLDCPFDHEDD